MARRTSVVLFDLDRIVLDTGESWTYTIQEAVATVARRRVDARPLVEQYVRRPWRDALAILLPSKAEQARAEGLCRRIWTTSALKRLMVFEGLPVALDRLRTGHLEAACISRLPRPLALKQIHSTGLDRFFAALATPPAGAEPRITREIQACIAFLGRRPDSILFASDEPTTLTAAASLELSVCAATWTGSAPDPPLSPIVTTPQELVELALATRS